jgi:hypothetical protein
MALTRRLSFKSSTFGFTPKKHNGDYLYDTEVDGKRWIRMRMQDWRENLLIWCNQRTVERVIKKLLDRDLILSEKLDTNHFGHTKYYTINYNHPDMQYLSEQGETVIPD